MSDSERDGLEALARLAARDRDAPTPAEDGEPSLSELVSLSEQQPGTPSEARTTPRSGVIAIASLEALAGPLEEPSPVVKPERLVLPSLESLSGGASPAGDGRGKGPPPLPPAGRGMQALSAPRVKPGGLDLHALIEGQALEASCGTRYRVVRELGRGNMGVVIHAQRQGRAPCDVALKFVLDGGEIESLVREYSMARLLNGHRYIAESNILDTVAGVPFGEFQYIKGDDLERIVGLHLRGDLAYSVPQLLVAWAGWQTAEALIAAHESEVGEGRRGILHKDIKPGNIMIDANGTVKVLDFGLARDVAFVREEMLAGRVTGTPVIIPSELLMRPRDFAELLGANHGEVWGAGEDLIDGRADVFSLACTMYYMLTGVYPSMPDAVDAAARDNPLVAINEMHHRPLNPPHLLVEAISPVLSKVVYLGAHPDPRLRPDARTFHRLLGGFIYPNTIGQGVFASHVRAYLVMVRERFDVVSDEAQRLREIFEKAQNIIQANPQHYPLHDELEARFEAARARDLAHGQSRARGGRLRRSLSRLPLLGRGGERELHDVFTPRLDSALAREAEAAGRNPARYLPAEARR